MRRVYIKLIRKGMGRAETIVKLIGFTPVNSLVSSVKNMLPDASENDLVKICELKVRLSCFLRVLIVI